MMLPVMLFGKGKRYRDSSYTYVKYVHIQYVYMYMLFAVHSE